MATDQQRTLDFLMKTINSNIAKETLPQDYMLSLIYRVLKPECPYSRFFLAKVHYILENWPQAEKFALETIGILESMDPKAGFPKDILRESYYCRGRAQLMLGKTKEFEETVRILEEKGAEFRRSLEPLQSASKKVAMELEKYVRFIDWGFLSIQ